MPLYSRPILVLNLFAELSVYLNKNNVILKLQMGTGPPDIFRAGGPAQGISGGRPTPGWFSRPLLRAGGSYRRGGCFLEKPAQASAALAFPRRAIVRAPGDRAAGRGRRFRDARPGSLAGRPRRGSARFSEWHVRLGPCQMPRWAEVRGGATLGSKPGPGGCTGSRVRSLLGRSFLPSFP